MCRHILCVGGVMCMGRGVAHMVSKITFPPHQIAGEGRDGFMVSKHGFGFWDHVHMCRWGHVRFMLTDHVVYLDGP